MSQSPPPPGPLPQGEGEKIIKVLGQPIEKLPDDLFIPPEALIVFLEAFEGPLDLLLYLIRRQNLDIRDIPVLRITEQYMQYIELMRELRLELAAEYLLMAAWLAEIKSRALLPRPVTDEEEPVDPRMELVRRLQEYERFKTAAENLDRLPRVGRDIHLAQARPERLNVAQQLPVPHLRELLEALREVLVRAEMFTSHAIEREPLSVRDRMTRILARVHQGGPARFVELIDPAEGRAGVIVCLIAVLELVKNLMIELTQAGPFAQLVIGAARPRQAVVESD